MYVIITLIYFPISSKIRKMGILYIFCDNVLFLFFYVDIYSRNDFFFSTANLLVVNLCC